MPEKKVTKRDKSKRKTPGYLMIVRGDGIRLKLNNTVYVASELNAMIKTQDRKRKNEILGMINSPDSPDDYVLKRTKGTMFLIHKSRSIKPSQYADFY